MLLPENNSVNLRRISAVANQTLVIIPTYNEVENLPLIVERVLATKDAVDILVVDDN